MPLGGRADVMVCCPTAGTFAVGGMTSDLAELSVAGPDRPCPAIDRWENVSYPGHLKSLLYTPATTGCACKTVFGACLGWEGAVNHSDTARWCIMGINGVQFMHNVAGEVTDHSHITYHGCVKERHLYNFHLHTYHVHVFPFQLVASTDGQPDGERSQLGESPKNLKFHFFRKI